MTVKYSLSSVLLFFCSFLLIQNKLIIQSPKALSDFFDAKYGKGGIFYSIANYGEVPYGKTISGKVSIPSVLEDCVYEEMPSLNAPEIIMAERFDCTFTQKSFNIQKQGGKLAIIMDNAIEDPKSIVMIDDGFGFQVHIPTILISNQDGKEILKYKDEGVKLAVSFDVQTREKAEIQFWLDITDHKNMVFLRSFKPFFNRIASHVKTKVKYPISSCFSDCEASHCLSFKQKDESNVTYCRFPKPQDWWVQDAGKTIIEQQIFQHFLFKDDNELWWKYMLTFDDSCPGVSFYSYCRESLVKKLNINIDHIDGHLADTLANKNQSQENLLHEWQVKRSKNGIIYYPSIVVNNIVYRGNLQPLDVFQLICQSLDPQPSGCQQGENSSELSLTTLILVTAGIAVIFIIFLISCYRKMAKRQINTQMHGQVNALVNEYITMFEERKFEGEQQNIELEQKLKNNEVKA